MNVRVLSIAFVFMLSQLMCSCTKTAAVADITHSINLPAGGSLVVGASNQFAFSLLQSALQQDSSTTNKLISPLSIYFALGMAWNGAANATRDSMSNALQLHGTDTASLNRVCQSLLGQLPNEDNQVALSIANSIWYRQQALQPIPAFLTLIKSDYMATIESLDFNDPASVSTINNWVSQATDQKIPAIIESIDSGDIMFLINAVYFNGSWQHAFDAENTKNKNFYLTNSTTELAPFMAQQFTTRLYQNNSFTLVELPYGGGKSFSMFIAMPTNQSQSITNFMATVNEGTLNQAIAKLDSQNIQLYIPKWQYTYSILDMKPELTQLGMGIAFDKYQNADFSNLYAAPPGQVYISKAIHKTWIKVNEAGTQAAAATAIGIHNTTAPPPPPTITLDHPFFYAIVEKQTGAILFAGILFDPLQH